MRFSIVMDQSVVEHRLAAGHASRRARFQMASADGGQPGDNSRYGTTSCSGCTLSSSSGNSGSLGIAPFGQADAGADRLLPGSRRRSKWLRCAGTPPLIAQAPTAIRILQLRAELAQHMHVFRVAQPALDDADVAGAAMLDVGQRRAVELDLFEQIQQAVRRYRGRTCGSRNNRPARSWRR